MDSAEEIQLVLRVALRLCKKELEDTKQFRSCGAKLGANRNMELLRPEYTRATDIDKYVEYWGRQLRGFASQDDCRVLAWWMNAAAITDAGKDCMIFAHLEHVSGEALEICIPYSEGSAGEIAYGETTEEHAPQRYLFAGGKY
jgi:hypothetical protein